MVEIDYESCYWALKTQMEVQTRQLRQSLKFEDLLKQITDKVRDSLDEAQILQHAVEALGKELRLGACNAALYDLERRTSTIIFEYVRHFPSSLGRVALLDRYPEIYQQLLEGDYFQFCSIQPHPERGRVTMLACPICDNEGVIGDLWLVNPADYIFGEMEIRLVQQTANQCAIALRQARLYQASQQQVMELEQLHQLKDEFLSTVSHELRTPMTNMKMAIRMVELSLESLIHQVSPEIYGRLQQYITVLRGECERETSLINDLLDLQRLESEKWNLQIEPIDPYDLAHQLSTRFQARAEEHGRRFQLNLSGSLPLLESDRRALERILAELLNNACKYTPSLETISLRMLSFDEEMNFEVVNTGVEIPPAELPRLFDKFYRLPSTDPWKQSGTGLGLALARQLSLRLGGSLQATSAQQHTCFRLNLPLRISPEAGVAVAADV